MERKDSFREVDELDRGLDRSNVILQGQTQPPGYELGKESDDELSQNIDKQTDPRSTSQRLVDSIKQSKDEAKAKIKKTLSINKSSDDLAATEPPILANTSEKKSKSRLAPDQPPTEKEALKDFVLHPYDTVKAKVSNQGKQQVASQAGVKEIPHGQDVDIVEASAAVESAVTEKDRLLAIQDLSELLQERQNTYVRWTLDRHVTKVRTMPRDNMVRKPRSAFRKQNDQGETAVDWRAYALHLLEYHAHQYGGQYIGYGSDPPTPSQQAPMPNFERFIVLTSPLQQFLVAVRRVYCWERPKETAKYLLIYLTLWYLNLLLTGLLSSTLYFVIRHRFRKQSIEDLREDVKRREDARSTALSLTDFIDKHGENDWADRMLESLGTWFMIQLGDCADFIETMQNFYEWRNPVRTVSVLCVITAAILITAFTPAWLLLKTSTFATGIAFFALFPIATRFPEYRLLVSPSKRLLWNIPTHAEWAINFIQAEAARHKASTATNSPVKKSTSSSSCSSYKASHEKSPGHLLVSTDSVCFKPSIGSTVLFEIPYDQLERVEKHDRILRKHLPTRLAAETRQDLRFVGRNGREWTLKNVEKRSEAFTQAVGFSGREWQVVW